VRISYAAADGPVGADRNSIGAREYLRSGAARLESVYGSIAAGSGDMCRPCGPTPPVDDRQGTLVPGDVRNSEPLQALVIEARGHIPQAAQLPVEYGNSRARRHTASATARARRAAAGRGRGRAGHRRPAGLNGDVCLPPLRVVGWDGRLDPYAFNIADSSDGEATHAPLRCTRSSRAPFVIGSFCPRPLDSIPRPSHPVNHTKVASGRDALLRGRWYYLGPKGVGVRGRSITMQPAGFTQGAAGTRAVAAVIAGLAAGRTDEGRGRPSGHNLPAVLLAGAGRVS